MELDKSCTYDKKKVIYRDRDGFVVSAVQTVFSIGWLLFVSVFGIIFSAIVIQGTPWALLIVVPFIGLFAAVGIKLLVGCVRNLRRALRPNMVITDRAVIFKTGEGFLTLQKKEIVRVGRHRERPEPDEDSGEAASEDEEPGDARSSASAGKITREKTEPSRACDGYDIVLDGTTVDIARGEDESYLVTLSDEVSGEILEDFMTMTPKGLRDSVASRREKPGIFGAIAYVAIAFSAIMCCGVVAVGGFFVSVAVKQFVLPDLVVKNERFVTRDFKLPLSEIDGVTWHDHKPDYDFTDIDNLKGKSFDAEVDGVMRNIVVYRKAHAGNYFSIDAGDKLYLLQDGSEERTRKAYDALAAAVGEDKVRPEPEPYIDLTEDTVRTSAFWVGQADIRKLYYFSSAPEDIFTSMTGRRHIGNYNNTKTGRKFRVSGFFLAPGGDGTLVFDCGENVYALNLDEQREGLWLYNRLLNRIGADKCAIDPDEGFLE